MTQFAPSINDLAIALAYSLMQSQNLFDTLNNIIGSYNKIYPINDDEIYSLFGLIKSRLVITLVMAAKQQKKYPENKYLSISEKNAWFLIFKLNKIDPYFFITVIRNICNKRTYK